MGKKKLIIIISSVLLLIIIGVVLILTLAKGTLILNPKDQQIIVFVGTEKYTTFPQQIKLKKGVYAIRAEKEGYLEYNGEANISPLKTTEIVPELKKVTVIGHAPRGAFLSPTIPAGKDLVYYYNPRDNGFLKMDVDFTGKNLDDLGESTLSNNNIELVDSATEPYIRWSKNNNFVIFIANDTRIIVDLNTRGETTIPSDIKAIDFLSDKEIAYFQNGSIYKSKLDFTNPVKVASATFDSTVGFSSPAGQKMVFANDDQFAIYDFKDTKTVKNIAEKIKKASWLDDDTLAISSKKEKGLVVETVDLKAGKTSEVGALYENGFAWASPTNIIFTKEDQGTVSLITKNIKTSEEKVIYDTPVRNTIEALTASDKKLIFTIGSTLYMLNL